MSRNSEGYSDPTAEIAIGNVTRDEKRRKQVIGAQAEIKCRPKVYVVSKYAGDIKANTANAVHYCRYAIKHKRIPVASHLLYPAILRDDDARERELGLTFGLALLALCDEVWVFGKEHSVGMRAEIAEAERLGKPIRYFYPEVQHAKE